MGFSGSGKSTLARQLGERFSAPVLHLDAVEYRENWQKRDREEALAIVFAFMAGGDWVIDGNYSAFLQRERLDQADVIAFLLFPRFQCLWRAVSRYVRFWDRSRPDIADGCIEKLDLEFVWWILHAGRTAKIKAKFKEMAEKYRDKTVVFKTQRQVDPFLRQL